MNILITGHRGFVGRHLKKGLLGKLPLKKIFVSDSSRLNLLEPLDHSIINCELDYIFHLAAWTKAGDFCLHHPGEQWINNQKINTNILCYWKEHQPQAKMVAFGTSCAYPPEKEKMEDNYFNGVADKDLFTYAMTKRMLLTGMQAFAKQYDMKFLYFIPNTLFGPDFDIEDSHFIFDLIKKICAAKYEGYYGWEEMKKVVLWGSGNQRRELIYVKDAIDLIINSLHLNNEIINIGTGKERSIKEYAKMICDYVEYNYEEIEFDRSAFEGVKSKYLPPNKIVGSCEKTSLVKAMKETIDYYIKVKYGKSIQKNRST